MLQPEIVTQAVRVLDKIAARHATPSPYTRAYMGGEAIDRFGDPLPRVGTGKVQKALTASCSVLISGGPPKWEGLPGDQRPEAAAPARGHVGLYANNRRPRSVQLADLP